jgi:hypothetical protein
MTRPTLALVALLATQMVSAQPIDDMSDFFSPLQERMKLAGAQSLCFKTEASSVSISNLDLDAAAHEVVDRRCTAETERFKTIRAEDFAGNVAEFERWWRDWEAVEIDYVKSLIGKIRTTK